MTTRLAAMMATLSSIVAAAVEFTSVQVESVLLWEAEEDRISILAILADVSTKPRRIRPKSCVTSVRRCLVLRRTGIGMPMRRRLVRTFMPAVEYKKAFLLMHFPGRAVFQAFSIGVHSKMLMKKAAE
jgi:hypothetical protein